MATLGNIDITNISLGNSEVSSISLGEIEVYPTGPTSPWRFVGLDDSLERASGTSVTCYGLYKYRGSDIDIEIPSEFNELPVRTIEENCFKDNAVVESVTIPNSIIKIKNNCFQNCTTLEEITCGTGLLAVGDYAFDGCTSLTDVMLSESVTTIGRYAFQGCNSLQYTYLGSSLDSIDSYAFQNATGEIICGHTNATITYIDTYMFRNFKGTKLVIPNSVTSMYRGALYGCSNLVSLSLPFIGDKRHVYADTNQYPLGYVFGTSSFTGTSAVDQWYFTKNNAYWSHQTYYIPDSLREVAVTGHNYIQGYAFHRCRYLTDLIFGEGVEIIDGDYKVSSDRVGSMYECYNLTNISLPSTLTTLKRHIFTGTAVANPNTSTYDYLTLNIYYAGSISDWCSVSVGESEDHPSYHFYIEDQQGSASYKNKNYSLVTQIDTTDFPQDITTIGTYQFSYFLDLYSVKLPENLVTVNSYAFTNCDSLASVTLPSTLTTINSSAFNNRVLVEVINHSNLTLTKGSTNNGDIAYNAIDIFTDPEYTSHIENDNDTFIKYTSINDNKVYLVRCISNKNQTLTVGNSYTNINKYAFYKCRLVPEVNLSANIDTISPYAFYDCEGLTSVSLGLTSISSLESYVFSDCISLETASIPSTVTSIKERAFNNCKSLEAVTIPNIVTNIGEYAFSRCESLTQIVIPDSVTTMTSGVFYQCSNLETITIGTGLTTLPNYTFGYCASLDNVVIPNNIVTLGEGVFKECSSLQTISIGSGIKTITKNTFYNCTSLGPIVIPATVTSIGQQAFYHCPSSISWAAGTTMTSVPNNAFAGWSGTQISIPSTFTSFGQSAFNACPELTTFTIPDNITSIGTYCFAGCPKLITMNIEASITSIPSDCFRGCSSLTNLLLPSSLRSIGNVAFSNCDNLVNIYYKGTFADWCAISISGTTSSPMYSNAASTFYILDPNGSIEYEGDTYSIVTEINIPDTVTSIGAAQFCGFNKVEEIIIPNTVTSIGDEAFYNCDQLTSLIIPNGVTSIGQKAFYGCSSLTSINIPDGITTINQYLFCNCSSLTSIHIPTGVTSIGNYAFKNCSSLTSITIPNGVTSFSNSGLLNGCSSLVSITIPFIGNKAHTGASSDTYQYPFGYIFGTDSYTGGTSTKQYYYGSSTSSTTNTTYYIPSSLRNVTVTGGTYLTRGAFYQCSMLTNVVLPNTMTTIGHYAFYWCTNITSITLPNALDFIDFGAFYSCQNLASLTIPNTVTSINGSAFTNCKQLTTIVIPTDTNISIIKANTFQSCNELVSLTIPDSVTVIEDYAFQYCTKLTSLTIPEGVTSIGQYAFGNCVILPSLTIPNSVTSIGSYAFQGYTGQIVWGNNPSISVFNAYMFDHYGGQNINIPSTITSINGSAFYYSSITYISIPATVTTIASGAFIYCNNLARIDLQTTDPTVTYLSNVYATESSPKIGVHAELLDKVLIDLEWDSNRVECLDVVYPTAINFINNSSYTAKQFTLTAALTPAYANTDNTITYSVVSGSEYITFDNINKISINEGVENQTIRVRAVTGLNNSLSDEMDINITYANQTYSVDRLADSSYPWLIDSGVGPDGETIYKSNMHNHSGSTYCLITISGYETFKMMIKNDAEGGNWDYTTVYVDNNVTITDKNSDSSFNLYTLSGLGSTEHTLKVTYQKDSSYSSGTDTSYFYIPINQD